MNTRLRISTGALLLAAALQASAATLPQAKTENGVSYLSGGIGQDEAAAMRAEAKDYPLSMVFSAGKDNEYLAGVTVTIKDKTGKQVLNTASTGPILLVKLPAGRYSIAAERNGQTLRRTVQVNHHGDKRVNFHWASA